MKKYWMLESFHEQILSNRLISRLETQQSWEIFKYKNQQKISFQLKINLLLCVERV